MRIFSKFLTWFLTILAFVCNLTAHAQTTSLPSTLRIGLIPNVSSAVLMANYAPLQNFLISQGFKKVDLVSSNNFKEFNEQTKAQQFDLIVTAPHMARLAQVDYKWTPLASMTPNTRALLISSIDEPNWPSQLKNTNIAYANPQSLVAMIGNKWLLSKGLTAETDYKQVIVPREDNIGGMILAGDAKFGILSNAELRSIPERIQSKLKVLEVLAEIPNFVVLTNANFSTFQNEQMKALFTRFAEKNEHGEAFFKLSGFTSIRPVSDLQMKGLDTFLVQTRAALGQ